MLSKPLRRALELRLPVLFVYIGWAQYYDGTEPIMGNFAWIKEHPDENSESEAFLPDHRGIFKCGIGRGATDQNRLHLVFVARDPFDQFLRIVGVYAAARIDAKQEDDDWPRARTKHAILFAVGQRPAVGE